mmetsp:Transcript_6314/g.18936  ORF Transcript_6314/g.18936 Transcript_6314/m.18936 type:complete len:555 (-) Transcript_6314:363-2027(-)
MVPAPFVSHRAGRVKGIGGIMPRSRALLTDQRLFATDWPPHGLRRRSAGLCCHNNHQVLEGAIPSGFPAGMYARNGPNPYHLTQATRMELGPLSARSAPHWFEGDGMVHAVTFEAGRAAGKPMTATYRNRFVRTAGLAAEKDAGRALFRPLIDADAGGMLLSVAANALNGSVAGKNTANTSVVAHAGRLLALNEGGCPHVLRADLSTVGEETFGGKLEGTFTAHPKKDPRTGELVFFGTDFLGDKPFARIGVLGKDGELKSQHAIENGLDVPSLMHDCAATDNYTVLIDVPINSRPERMGKGESPIQFEAGKALRFGVVPRHGPASAVRWLTGEPGMIFHTANAWEEEGGEAIVIRAMLAPSATITPPSNSDAAYKEWIKTEFVTGNANVCKLVEIRLDLTAGTVASTELPSAESALMEFPTINPAAAMRDNGFTYAALLDARTSEATGAPVYGGLAKLSHASGGFEKHLHGEGRFGGEPQFVPRGNVHTAAGAGDGSAEDDGWVVTLVHDEAAGRSEVVIIDAQRFGEGPVCRMALPQRAPFGLHGTFVPAEA